MPIQVMKLDLLHLKKGDDFTFSFAFIFDELKNQSQNLLRISGTVKKSILAEDNDLLSYLLSLNI